MTAVVGALDQVPPAGAYALVVVVVLAESVLFIGAFVPTLTLLLAAGGLARTGQLSLLVLIGTAAATVVAGDFVAYRTGRVLGARVRTGRLGCRLPASVWQRTEALMERRGGHAVFLGRFLPVVRTLTPHVAGATRLPYRRVAPYSVTAAVVWATAEAGAGYAAAASLQRALTLGAPALAVAATTAGAVLAWTKAHRRRRVTVSGAGSEAASGAEGETSVRAEPERVPTPSAVGDRSGSPATTWATTPAD